jgi:sugar phosphate isomerase/epimerase
LAGLRLGLKSSVKDVNVISELGPAFLETFIFPRDLIELKIDELVQRFGASGLPVVVHVPEYHGDVFVDLASDDPSVRKSSIEAVNLSIKLADALGSPHIVLHPGGISENGLDRPKAIKRLRKALEELSYERFYLENMPWFYFKARRTPGKTVQVKSNIMIAPEDYAIVLDNIAGMTLDICHGFLSTKKGSMKNLLALFDAYPKLPRYLHLSDAKAPDGEGLQLGDGQIDLGPVYDRLRKNGKDWWGIPEIMDGHRNGGSGFAKALKILKESGV